MFCENCGTKNEAGTMFCENCGARLEAEAQPTYASQPQPQQPYQPTYQPEAPKKKSKLPLIIIAIVVAIGVAVGAYFLLSGGKDDSETESSAVKLNEINNSPENAALAMEIGVTTNQPDMAIQACHPATPDLEANAKERCEELAKELQEADVVCSNHRALDTVDCSDQILNAEDYYEETCGLIVDVQDVKMVTIRIDRTIGSQNDVVDIDVYVSKIDGKWYFTTEADD